jgi:hypothetical protein
VKVKVKVPCSCEDCATNHWAESRPSESSDGSASVRQLLAVIGCGSNHVFTSLDDTGVGNNNGETLLRLACPRGNIEIVKFNIQEAHVQYSSVSAYRSSYPPCTSYNTWLNGVLLFYIVGRSTKNERVSTGVGQLDYP